MMSPPRAAANGDRREPGDLAGALEEAVPLAAPVDDAVHMPGIDARRDPMQPAALDVGEVVARVAIHLDGSASHSSCQPEGQCLEPGSHNPQIARALPALL
jgi:hypothetical protein